MYGMPKTGGSWLWSPRTIRRRPVLWIGRGRYGAGGRFPRYGHGLGRKDTLSVTLDEMIHHCRAVVQGIHHALVVADMPFMTYEPGPDTALSNAARLVRESGVRAVKLEGAFLPQIRALVGAGIPVMGHIGLTPQRSAQLGGFKVQGKRARSSTAVA